MSEQIKNEGVYQSKKIIKRRLFNMKKQYLVPNGALYEWKNENENIRSEIQQFDESMREHLPYFPVVFGRQNKKIKMILEDKKLKIFYNDIEMDRNIQLSKEVRLQIIQELQKLFDLRSNFVFIREQDKKTLRRVLNQ